MNCYLHTPRESVVKVGYTSANAANEDEQLEGCSHGQPPVASTFIYDAAGILVLEERGLGYRNDFENPLVEVHHDDDGIRDDGQNVLDENILDAQAEALQRFYVHGPTYIGGHGFAYDLSASKNYYLFCH